MGFYFGEPTVVGFKHLFASLERMDKRREELGHRRVYSGKFIKARPACTSILGIMQRIIRVLNLNI